MRTTKHQDLATGVTTVRLAGDLNVATATTVRAAIGKAAAECPPAVLVDLSDVCQADVVRLNVLAAATHQAQQAWGVPVLLYAPTPRIRMGLGAFRTFVSVHENRWEALTAAREQVPPWIRERLSPVPTAAAAARAVLDEACLIWKLRPLRESARLIASELAANATLHAATAFELTAGYTGRYLRIAVQDGSNTMPDIDDMPALTAAVPPPEAGRGLRLVEALSSYWGVTRIPGGKIVWALLRTVRRRSPGRAVAADPGTP
jgi:anti-anti-sigma regulatory factor